MLKKSSTKMALLKAVVSRALSPSSGCMFSNYLSHFLYLSLRKIQTKPFSFGRFEIVTIERKEEQTESSWQVYHLKKSWNFSIGQATFFNA